MKFVEQTIPGVILVEPDVHRDDRGFFLESYHAGKYREAGIEVGGLRTVTAIFGAAPSLDR